jgi:Fe-coproporphyrin III synthase
VTGLRYPLTVLQNRMGTVPKPSWCTYLVDNRCNASCGMCDSWRLERGYEMTPEEVATVFGKIGRLDVLRLTGGEPFLRADFLEVAEAALEASNPRFVHVTTNGSFSDRVEHFAERFSRPKRLHIMVSFDGLEAVHNRSRGRRVTFDKALATVKKLVGLRASRGVGVSVNHTVISTASMDDAEGLRNLFRTLDVDVHWVLAYADTAMYGRSRRGTRAQDLIVVDDYPLHDHLDRGQSLAFVEAQQRSVSEIRDAKTRMGKRYYLEGLASRLAQTPKAWPKPKCTALRSHIRLLPSGEVPVCQFNTEVVGDLKTQTFDEIWFGRATETPRAWVDACTGCWAECEVMPSALYSGDLAAFAARVLGRVPGR